MPEIELEQKNEQIIVRLRLSTEVAVRTRNDLKEGYTNIPKLNKETFESFGRWVFDDLDDALVQNFIDNIEDDDSSVFEPW
jgi:hypothetical protein